MHAQTIPSQTPAKRTHTHTRHAGSFRSGYPLYGWSPALLSKRLAKKIGNIEPSISGAHFQRGALPRPRRGQEAAQRSDARHRDFAVQLFASLVPHKKAPIAAALLTSLREEETHERARTAFGARSHDPGTTTVNR